MSRWRSVLVAVGIAVAVGGLYLGLFGVQTMSALVVRYESRKTPDVTRLPVPLPDLSVSKVPHKKVSYFGYEFELPWDDVDEQKSKTNRTVHLSCFRSGDAFWFSTFPPRSFVNEIMEEGNFDPQRFRQMFGDKAFESDYGFHREILETTPSQITPFISRHQAAAGQLLLMFKGISMPRAHSGIFSIQGPELQGFQFENPKTQPFSVTDELYSSDGGIDLIFFQKVDGTAPTISQSEINRVIESIRKVSRHPALLPGLSGNR